MNRKAFDRLSIAGGLVLTLVLVVAGTLLMWGHNFADNHVKTELTAQQIFFPPKGTDALAPKEIGPFLNQYAGQQLTTGPQAQAYANHFIGEHVKGIANGQTYSQVSSKLIALESSNPNSPQVAVLQGQQDALFKGETLRGLLLNAYAWWKMGQIALWGSIISFILAGVMFVLSVMGMVHLRRTKPDAEIFVDHPKATTPVTVT